MFGGFTVGHMLVPVLPYGAGVAFVFAYGVLRTPLPIAVLHTALLESQVSTKGIYPVSQGVASRVNGSDLQTLVSYVVLDSGYECATEPCLRPPTAS